MVTDVSFRPKTEAIELESRVALPVQLWEHGAIQLHLVSGLPGVLILLRDYIFPLDNLFLWLALRKVLFSFRDICGRFLC